MTRKDLWLVATTMLVLALTACGGGDSESDTTPAPATSETTAPASNNGGGSDTTAPPETTATTAPAGGNTPAVTEMGSFSVNGMEFAVTFLNRCIPFGGEDGQTIDLQPLAQGQGAQLNLYGTADLLEVSVQGGTVQAEFGSIAFAADTFGDGEIQASSIDGDRWTGSATLLDSLGSGTSVELTWDVMIPDEVIDCSL